MMMSQQDVKPTRTELLKVKKKIATSRTGHRLLKMKRDGLIMSFFEILNEAREIREKLDRQYREARDNMAIASAVEGAVNVKSVAFALTSHPQIGLKARSIMGVEVPTVEASKVRKPLRERGYGLIGTSPFINDAARSYEALVETIIRAAEVETTLKRLLEEIDRTKRRVNALEFKVIPGLEEAERFIEFRLEEMERENVFRLKFIKARSGE